MFLANFLCQKAELVLGRDRLHVGHLCQKQPWTKTATFERAYTMSGLPGRLLETSFLRRSLASVSSGIVPDALLDLIEFVTDLDEAFGDLPTGLVE